MVLPGAQAPPRLSPAVWPPAEIELLSALAHRPQRVLLRLSPGIDVHGHPAVRTGVIDQKFGLPLGSAMAVDAVRSIAEMAWIRREHGHLLTELDLGGGHPVAYRPGDAELNTVELAGVLDDALDTACARHRFPRPVIAMEPGRAIVARAGVGEGRNPARFPFGSDCGVFRACATGGAVVALDGIRYRAQWGSRGPPGRGGGTGRRLGCRYGSRRRHRRECPPVARSWLRRVFGHGCVSAARVPAAR
ncbi:hypothetical protein [Nocardia sp. NBC_00416]|uniref:hypothetical protein n=1 Tax=Nocardia sp. NBC_00416 TaxID=2975991 RepID=UPI003FA5BFF3